MYHNNSDIHKQSQTCYFRVSWEICLWIECCHVLPLFIFSSLIISRSDSDSGLEFWFEVLVSELARGLKQPTIITFPMETKGHPIEKDNRIIIFQTSIFGFHVYCQECIIPGNKGFRWLPEQPEWLEVVIGLSGLRVPQQYLVALLWLPCPKGVLYILPALLQFWVGEPSHPI